MDQPDLDAGRHEEALRGLERINFWGGASRVFWPRLHALARTQGQRALRVLDLASGAGDGVIRLWQRAQRARLPMEIDGCDRSAIAIEHARRSAETRHAGVRFFSCDVLQDSLPGGYDVVLNSLFLHHLDEGDAVTFLRRAAGAAGRALLVSDLVRGPVGLVLAYLATRVLSRSPVVHYDGPVSIEGAFSPGELRGLASRAGLSGAEVTRHWPCHMLLSWNRL
jgi:SAM-dependent methyltransferase